MHADKGLLSFAHRWCTEHFVVFRMVHRYHCLWTHQLQMQKSTCWMPKLAFCKALSPNIELRRTAYKLYKAKLSVTSLIDEGKLQA